MEKIRNLINVGPTNKPHLNVWRFCMCPSHDTFDKNIKNLELGTRAQQQRQESF